MKKNILTNSVIMLFAFLLVTSTISAQVTTEEDMAKAVFESIKTSDLEKFSSYLATDEKMALMLDGMQETTPKEKGVKQELKEENVASIRKECINPYNALIKELSTNNIAIDKGVFSDLTQEVRLEVPNCQAVTIGFVMTFNDNIPYKVEIDVFKTKTDLFIYTFFARNLYEQKP